MDRRINSAPVDRWTLAHLGSGALLGLTDLHWGYVLVGSILFEVLENTIQPAIPSVFPNTADHDSWPNAICDVLCVLGGFLAVQGLRRWRREVPRG